MIPQNPNCCFSKLFGYYSYMIILPMLRYLIQRMQWFSGGPKDPGSGDRGSKDLGTRQPRDPRTWGRGTQGLTLECTVCVHTVASSLGKYPGPHVERVFTSVDLCLYSLEWNVDWSSGMGYRFFFRKTSKSFFHTIPAL